MRRRYAAGLQTNNVTRMQLNKFSLDWEPTMLVRANLVCSDKNCNEGRWNNHNISIRIITLIILTNKLRITIQNETSIMKQEKAQRQIKKITT